MSPGGRKRIERVFWGFGRIALRCTSLFRSFVKENTFGAFFYFTRSTEPCDFCFAKVSQVRMLRSITKKIPSSGDEGIFLVAGAGFEPATLWL